MLLPVKEMESAYLLFPNGETALLRAQRQTETQSEAMKIASAVFLCLTLYHLKKTLIYWNEVIRVFQYIIQPGDTLNQIANQFGVTIAAIIAANAGLTPQLVFPGQIILIPIQVPLRQNYPWYFVLPNLFNRFPRRQGPDRGHRHGDGRDRDHGDRRDGRR